MLCAQLVNGKCTKDTGGSLQCRSSSGEWVLSGMSIMDDRCSSPDLPGLYTGAAKFVDWMKRYIQGIADLMYTQKFH